MSNESKGMKDRMSNIVELFPNATDEQYEDTFVPILINEMKMLWAANEAGDRQDVIRKLQAALLKYFFYSMETLDAIRRHGVFDDNKLPGNVAYAFDNLAADYIQAVNDKDVSEFVKTLRTRSIIK